MTSTDNKAWAEFKTPLRQDALIHFCRDIEQLFKINPYLEIKQWKNLGPQKYFIDVVNHSQNHTFSLKTNIYVTDIDDGIKIEYENGIKSETILKTLSIPEGSKLKITEKYHSPSSNDTANELSSVDKSLTKWAEEVQNYVIDWQRWSWFLPWKLYKQRIWLPMKPMARRITYMIIWISIIEIALILLGVTIYFLEFR